MEPNVTASTASTGNEASTNEASTNAGLDAMNGTDFDLGYSVTNGRKNTIYSLGDELTLDLAKPQQRATAEQMLLHLYEASDQEGIPFSIAPNLNLDELPEQGRVTFCGKFVGKGDARELAAQVALYVPSMAVALEQSDALTREFFENRFAETMIRIARDCIRIEGEGDNITAKLDGMPTSVFDILAPKARSMGADPFQPVAVAFAALFLAKNSRAKAIPAMDLKRCLLSAHYAETSAYRDFERPVEGAPQGQFAFLLDRLGAMLSKLPKTAGEANEISNTIVAGIKGQIKGKKADDITLELLLRMRDAQWAENTKANRVTALLKVKQVEKTESEKASDALLSLI